MEGCDGTGKSSLAHQIAERLQILHPDDTVREIHSGPLDQDPVEEYIGRVHNYLPGVGYHIVADRWHYGEMIYGPLYRDRSAIDTSTWSLIEHWLDTKGAVAYVVSQPLDRLRARLEARGEDFLQSHHVEHVRDEFDTIKYTSVIYEGTVEPEGDTNDIVDTIIRTARRREDEMAVGSTTNTWLV